MEKIITALETQKRNPDRLNVYLDNEFAFGVSKFVGAWLTVGQALPEDKVRDLVNQDEREQAYQQALRFIGYKPRTVFEVKRKLEEADFSAEIIQDVLTEFENKSYLDDQDFARQWVETRSASKPRSHFLLTLELKKKGVPEDAIEGALASIPEDEILAEKFGQRYQSRLMGTGRESFKKKMIGALQRKGFSYGIAMKVADRLQNLRTGEVKSED